MIFLIKVFFSLILLIGSIILFKSDDLYYKYYDLLFSNSIDFSYIRSKSKFIFNKLILNKEQYVSSEQFRYENVEEYNGGYIFTVDYNYIINNIKSGVVCFIGKKESLGNTIIIETDEGLNIWYSNIENVNVNLYDYIKEDTILGNSIDNKIIITFKNKDEYLSYEDFI